MHETTNNRPLAPRFMIRLLSGLSHHDDGDQDQQPSVVIPLTPGPDRVPGPTAERQPAA